VCFRVLGHDDDQQQTVANSSEELQLSATFKEELNCLQCFAWFLQV
jgi:hypothetical protein